MIRQVGTRVSGYSEPALSELLVNGKPSVGCFAEPFQMGA